MRKGISAALIAGLLCVAGMARQAEATVTIELEWGECGGGTVGCYCHGHRHHRGEPRPVVRPSGSTSIMSHDLTQGLESHTFSLNFDTSLDNELNLGPMAQTEWSGTDVHPGRASCQSLLAVYGGRDDA